MKRILTVGLLAFALIGAAFALKKRIVSDVTAPTSSGIALPDNGIVVTYFTTDIRCPSCHKIEEWTRDAVNNRFADKLKSGELMFRVVNTDRPENKHFIDDYQLVSKTVIASFRAAGVESRFANLQDVWLNLDNPQDLENYIVTALK